MAYATEDQIRQRLPELDHLLQAGSFTPADYITDAQSWADGVLEAAGFDVPLSTPPALVTLACSFYAAALILEGKNDHGEFTEKIESMRSEAWRIITMVQSGEMDIPGEDTTRVEAMVPDIVDPNAGV